ncbi:O-methyltransferase [Sinanaerobacter sp. ZZT-01]|uniref:O-methyltransferase n=1 Tax=Sinanaerobacter sp. ZZT-01 TaxID=3111540 RepID=UPI002D790F10|nr:O-methyltransferase [Sinanaerobacter sp. ZZT-01]WRR93144.1 O-methyltransferase [Sinanaerobacter sp. ZZT-01]
MNIITQQVTAYLDELYRPLNSFLEELRKEAENNHVPIILRDTEQLLGNLLRMRQPKKILEIGTAVGYSAIYFAAVCDDALITTLEISEENAEIAIKNIENAGESERIQIIKGDAKKSLVFLQKQMKEEQAVPYDFIFIDAAKAQYQAFWDACQPLCKKNTLIVSDNILFKGMTASDDFVLNRRYKTIVRRMREYLNHITNTEIAETCVLAVGDGVAVSLMKE